MEPSPHLAKSRDSGDAGENAIIDKELRQEFRDYLWNYFSLHSEQRLKTFHFYILLVAALIAGYSSLSGSRPHPPDWLLMLPALLALASFIFWQLDVRTKGMIKTVELALCQLDLHAGLPPGAAMESLRIFEFEATTRARFRPSPLRLTNPNFSYSQCFNSLFLCFGILGATLTVWHVRQLLLP